RRPVTRFRAFYFLYYAGLGVSLPYFAPYLRGLGLSGTEIGTLQMVTPLLLGPVGLAWAALADRIGAPARALRLAAALAAAAQLRLPFARSFASLAAVLVAMSLFVPALVPLIDTVTIEALRGRSYARTRLFGSLGYVATAQLVGLVLSARGDRPLDG